MDKKTVDVEEVNSVLEEFLYETEYDILNYGYEQMQEHEQTYNNGEMDLEETGEEEKLNYQEIRMQIILSDIEEKLKWDKYKLYIDKIVLKDLQDTTINRYTRKFKLRNMLPITNE